MSSLARSAHVRHIFLDGDLAPVYTLEVESTFFLEIERAEEKKKQLKAQDLSGSSLHTSHALLYYTKPAKLGFPIQRVINQ
jgi:hypothetical protein